jgi:prophage antirepressor-like protein
MKFEFQDISIEVTPTNDHRRWYMTVEDVAVAYGRTRNCIMNHLREHADELREGIEKGVSFSYTLGGPQEVTILYRDGVIKMGMFVRSQRAKAFRQFATDIVVEYLDREELGEGPSLARMMDQINDRFSRTEQSLQDVKDICRGLRDEVDELRATLNLLISEDDEKTIRTLIVRIKDKFNCDGRTVVGKVRSTLNMASIYETPDTRKVINTLRNILGEGLTLIQ